MPRCARIKFPNCTYHIIVRSISDINLFRDNDDKDKYLSLLKKYKDIFSFKIYAFCLMDTHAHFMINSNGADLSKFMHHINQCYSQYYNKKYKRHGHVFNDRFKSIVVTDDKYAILLSYYIHNNPKDISAYKNRIDYYTYSSLRTYLGLDNSFLNIVDPDFILNYFDKENITKARIQYISRFQTNKAISSKEIYSTTVMSEYRSEKSLLLERFSADDVVKFVYNYFNLDSSLIHIKSHRDLNIPKGICILLLHSLCNLTYKEICLYIKNITLSSVACLFNHGYITILENTNYKNIINDFIKYKCA